MYVNIGAATNKPYVIRIFSKCLSGQWPNIPGVVERCHAAMEMAKNASCEAVDA